MNKRIIESIVDEVDAVLSSPLVIRGADAPVLIDSEVRSEVRRLLENYLRDAPEPETLMHQTRRR